MKTYYKYRGRLVDICKHFNCDDGLFKVIRNNVDDVGRLVIRRPFTKPKYISYDKVVLESELTDDLRKLIVEGE